MKYIASHSGDRDEHDREQPALRLGLACDAGDRGCGESVADGRADGAATDHEPATDDRASQLDRLLGRVCHVLLLSWVLVGPGWSLVRGVLSRPGSAPRDRRFEVDDGEESEDERLHRADQHAGEQLPDDVDERDGCDQFGREQVDGEEEEHPSGEDVAEESKARVNGLITSSMTLSGSINLNGFR